MIILVNNYLVSVIIPTYNRESTILRAIKSVLTQHYQNFEIIIVDDCSSDRTVEIIKNLSKKDKRIKLLLNEKNRGPNYSRNRGIKHSKGQYIALLDSDDEWLRSKLKKQLEHFHNKTDEKLGVIYCGAIFIDKKNKTSYQMPQKEGKMLNELLRQNYILAGGSNCLIKKKVFDECGLFDESSKMLNKQDYELWLRVAQKFKFAYVNDYLVKIYFSKGVTYEGQIRDPIKGVISSLYIIKKHKELYKKYPQGLSDHLKYVGLQYLWAHLPVKARKYFKLSIKYYSKNFTSYIFLCISFLKPLLGRFISLEINRLYLKLQ